MRDAPWTAEGSAEGIESLRCLPIEAVRVRVEGIVLQIFEQAAVIVIGSALGRKRDVANLGEFGAVVEGCNFHCRDAFLRWIGVLKRSILTNIGSRDAVDGEIHHGAARPTEGDIAGTVLLHVR